MKKEVAKISSLQSFATLDGVGVRFAVYFHGCNLRCNYCHNPETWGSTNFEEISCDELILKVLNYKPYFKNSGGVTLSGGEPLGQAEFLIDFCTKLKENNINIVLDTAGCVKLDSNIKKVIELVDHVILDLKFSTEQEYKTYTGGSFAAVLKFLDMLQENNKKTWVRSVIVPNINDTESKVEKYLEIINKYSCIEKYELLAFSTLGFSKYTNLNLNNPLANTPALNEAVKDKLQKHVNKLIKNKIT